MGKCRGRQPGSLPQGTSACVPPPSSARQPTPHPGIWLGKHQEPEMTLSGAILQLLGKVQAAVQGRAWEPRTATRQWRCFPGLSVPLRGMGSIVVSSSWGFESRRGCKGLCPAPAPMSTQEDLTALRVITGLVSNPNQVSPWRGWEGSYSSLGSPPASRFFLESRGGGREVRRRPLAWPRLCAARGRGAGGRGARMAAQSSGGDLVLLFPVLTRCPSFKGNTCHAGAAADLVMRSLTHSFSFS